jgi:hypothetical protein
MTGLLLLMMFSSAVFAPVKVYERRLIRSRLKARKSGTQPFS